MARVDGAGEDQLAGIIDLVEQSRQSFGLASAIALDSTFDTDSCRRLRGDNDGLTSRGSQHWKLHKALAKLDVK